MPVHRHGGIGQVGQFEYAHPALTQLLHPHTVLDEGGRLPPGDHDDRNSGGEHPVGTRQPRLGRPFRAGFQGAVEGGLPQPRIVGSQFVQRGFLGMSVLFLVSSAFTLAKVVRDQQESASVSRRLDEARMEKLMAEHDPFKSVA